MRKNAERDGSKKKPCLVTMFGDIFFYRKHIKVLGEKLDKNGAWFCIKKKKPLGNQTLYPIRRKAS